MKYLIHILLLVFSSHSWSNEIFPDHMKGEWEGVRVNQVMRTIDYVYLRINDSSGFMQLSIGLDARSQDNCWFKLDSKPIAKDIYNIMLDECVIMNPKKHQGSAIILIPGFPNEMEFKRVDYGSRGYRNDLFSTVLYKVRAGVNLRDLLEKLRASREETINKSKQQGPSAGTR